MYILLVLHTQNEHSTKRIGRIHEPFVFTGAGVHTKNVGKCLAIAIAKGEMEEISFFSEDKRKKTLDFTFILSIKTSHPKQNLGAEREHAYANVTSEWCRSRKLVTVTNECNVLLQLKITSLHLSLLKSV